MKPIVDVDLAFNTRDLWEKDNKHFIHPYANYEHFSKEGSVIYVKGNGHSIYDSEGRSYLDGMAGLWCV
ncbi:MAG: hypothetical protein HRU12_13940, partial [Phaeodactylibacter sp.]|nr:hypothetical protein [Phaeodactylibacter sp.]